MKSQLPPNGEGIVSNGMVQAFDRRHFPVFSVEILHILESIFKTYTDNNSNIVLEGVKPSKLIAIH